MYARRLTVGGGGSSFPVPAAPTAYALAAPNEGGGVWFVGPQAVSYNGTTYWGYINGDGDVTARSTVNATKVTNTLVPGNRLYVGLEVDDHDNPGLVILADGTLLYFYSKHVGTEIAMSRSDNSEDVSSFTRVGLDAQIGGNYYTYINPVRLSGESNALYIFFRHHANNTTATPDWGYSKSTDGGTTWSAMQLLINTTYARWYDNGTDRIDVIASEHPNDTDRHEHSIWHAYISGGNFYKTDGTLIGALTAGPYATSTMTKVYDGATTYGWVWDVAYDGTRPYCTYITYPGNDGSNPKYNYGRWTGSAWDIHEIVAAGTEIGGEWSYRGGVNLDYGDPSKVWASVGVGGGIWEMRRYRTSDGGATWAYDLIAATGKNLRPMAVRNADPALQAIWWTDTYTSYVSFAQGTSGAGV